MKSVLAILFVWLAAGHCLADTPPLAPAPPDREQVISAAREVIHQAHFATLITVAENGQPQARIVDPAAPDSDFTVWIGTSPSTRKVAQLRKNPRTTLSYFDTATQSYVTLLGVAALVTDRFTSKNKTPSGAPAFDIECHKLHIELHLIPPRHPQTNGMVERFNGHISDVLATTRFIDGEQLETALRRHGVLYNQHIRQKALDHKTPLDALRDWPEIYPELFVKNVRKFTRPES